MITVMITTCDETDDTSWCGSYCLSHFHHELDHAYFRPAGSFWEWGPQARRGDGGRRLIGESGPHVRESGQARRGVGPAGSAGSQACSQTARAHNYVKTKQYTGPTR